MTQATEPTPPAVPVNPIIPVRATHGETGRLLAYTGQGKWEDVDDGNGGLISTCIKPAGGVIRFKFPGSDLGISFTVGHEQAEAFYAAGFKRGNAVAAYLLGQDPETGEQLFEDQGDDPNKPARPLGFFKAPLDTYVKKAALQASTDGERIRYTSSIAYEPLKQITDKDAGNWVSSLDNGVGEYYSSNPNNPFEMNMRVPPPNTVPRNDSGFIPYKIHKDSLITAALVKNPLDSTKAIVDIP